MSRSSSLVFVARSVGSVLSDEQIIRSEGYCLMCVCVCVCVCVCDLETITMRRPKPELGCCATEDKQINGMNILGATDAYVMLILPLISNKSTNLMQQFLKFIT